MSVYTKTGDKGKTALANGKRATKADPVFALVGGLDKLNSMLGFCSIEFKKLNSNQTQIFSKEKKLILKLQRDLFTVGAFIALASVKFDFEKETKKFESLIDAYERQLSRLNQFILPGGSALAGWLHLARTQAREVERLAVTDNNLRDQDLVLPYFNRLSDLLFTLARWVNFKLGVEETKL